MQKTYRIFTEDKNRGNVETLAAMFFDGFTMYEARGYWKGNIESSLVIEICADHTDRPKIDSLAMAIKFNNAQSAVLVQVLDNNSFFV